MTTAIDTPNDTTIRPGYRGFLVFSGLIGEELGAHQRKIARAYFGDAREICAILPRGNSKTTTAATSHSPRSRPW